MSTYTINGPNLPLMIDQAKEILTEHSVLSSRWFFRTGDYVLETSSPRVAPYGQTIHRSHRNSERTAKVTIWLNESTAIVCISEGE